MKRIVLFLMTNLAVLLVLSATMNVLGVGRYLTAQGLDLTQLLIFAAIVGFTGSIISLLISKPMAKASTGARIIDPQAPANARSPARRHGSPIVCPRRDRAPGSGHLRRAA